MALFCLLPVATALCTGAHSDVLRFAYGFVGFYAGPGRHLGKHASSLRKILAFLESLHLVLAW